MPSRSDRLPTGIYWGIWATGVVCGVMGTIIVLVIFG
jgi:hypothetical protein